MDSRYVDNAEAMSVRLITNGRQANVDGKITTSNGVDLPVKQAKICRDDQRHSAIKKSSHVVCHLS
ncbi:hypothetical protein QW180_20520 [Vibrio sinaloensis]|nr:hypothetical protein [Vibrio sinaloensis]